MAFFLRQGDGPDLVSSRAVVTGRFSTVLPVPLLETPMEVTATNGVKVYNISAGKATPLWLQEKKKRDKAYLKGLGTFLPLLSCSLSSLLLFQCPVESISLCFPALPSL